MSKSEKTKMVNEASSKQFSSYLNSLERAEMMLIITRISEGCMVPRYTVMNWKYGAARIPALAQCKIEEIIGKRIFN